MVYIFSHNSYIEKVLLYTPSTDDDDDDDTPICLGLHEKCAQHPWVGLAPVHRANSRKFCLDTHTHTFCVPLWFITKRKTYDIFTLVYPFQYRFSWKFSSVCTDARCVIEEKQEETEDSIILKLCSWLSWCISFQAIHLSSSSTRASETFIIKWMDNLNFLWIQ